MHYLYYTAIKKDKEITDNKKAIEQAQQALDNGNFAGHEGYWGGSKADWYVMGGRWSGNLQEIKLKNWDKKARELIESGKPKKDRNFISTADIEKNAVELQKLWVKLGGTGTNVWNRDQYKHDDSDDDCMLINDTLYKALVKSVTKKKPKDLWGEVEVAVIEDGCVSDETTLREFLKDKKIINKYFIAVVDYHN